MPYSDVTHNMVVTASTPKSSRSDNSSGINHPYTCFLDCSVVWCGRPIVRTRKLSQTLIASREITSGLQPTHRMLWKLPLPPGAERWGSTQSHKAFSHFLIVSALHLCLSIQNALYFQVCCIRARPIHEVLLLRATESTNGELNTSNPYSSCKALFSPIPRA